MKCEFCDTDATFHATEVDADGDAVSLSLCEHHARESGYPVPSADAMNASVVSNARLLAGFLREHRRMPNPNELMVTCGPTGLPREDTEEHIDAYIVYFDSLAEFVEQNARLPSDGEIHDPF